MTFQTSPVASATPGLPKNNNMADVIDALKRLERTGSENSKTTEKLIAAARELSQRIVAQFGLEEGEDIRVAEWIEKGTGAESGHWVPAADQCSSWDGYIIRQEEENAEDPDGPITYTEHRLLKYREPRYVAKNRRVALEFAEDIANGLLDAIALRLDGVQAIRRANLAKGLPVLEDALAKLRQK